MATTPKPGQVWRLGGTGRTVIIEDTDGYNSAFVRDVETGHASVMDMRRFNRRGTGWTFLRDDDAP